MANYILDSNVFIQAHRAHYPFDVVPTFWTKIIELGDLGNVCSIDKVRLELCGAGNTDILSTWCSTSLATSFFRSTSSCVQAYADVAKWTASHTRYNESAKGEFLATDLADSWLVAFAMSHGYTIVTHEVSSPGSIRKIKIPDSCNELGVNYINPIEMLRTLGHTI